MPIDLTNQFARIKTGENKMTNQEKLSKKIMNVKEWTVEKRAEIVDEIWLAKNNKKRGIYFALLEIADSRLRHYAKLT
tara:strand:+ start:283 stop:516 length:234 start_codon:yes stop_codon:yes gene_type:complete